MAGKNPAELLAIGCRARHALVRQWASRRGGRSRVYALSRLPRRRRGGDLALAPGKHVTGSARAGPSAEAASQLHPGFSGWLSTRQTDFSASLIFLI